MSPRPPFTGCGYQGPFTNAVTGGTGKYEKARGSVRSETVATHPKVVRRFTIRLV